MSTAQVSSCDALQSADWWTDFHTPEMADLLLVRRDPEEAEATRRFLVSQLELRPGSTVYDQCCGIGSLSIPLAREGIRVIGVDQCRLYVERARHDAAEANVAGTYLCEDAFRFVTPTPCEAVFNWYSSFGYADSDERNMQMLRRAYESLKPAGRFALEGPNFAHLLHHFQPVMTQSGRSGDREVCLTRESRIDLHTGTLHQRWTWRVAGCEPIERRSALRIYLPHQLADMLRSCGFGDVRLFGDLQAGPAALDRPRLICVAEK